MLHDTHVTTREARGNHLLARVGARRGFSARGMPRCCPTRIFGASGQVSSSWKSKILLCLYQFCQKLNFEPTNVKVSGLWPMEAQL